MEESFGETAGGAVLWEGLELVHASHRCGAEDAVDAFLRGERRAFQVGFRAQLLCQSRTLQGKNGLDVSTFNTPRCLRISLAVAHAHLLIGNRGLLLIGQLHQCADICAQISLAANEEDSCAGTKVQDLSFPLRRQKQAV